MFKIQLKGLLMFCCCWRRCIISKHWQSLNLGEKKFAETDTDLRCKQGTPLTILLFSSGHLGLHAHVQRRQRGSTTTTLASSSMESVGLEWMRILISTVRLKIVKWSKRISANLKLAMWSSMVRGNALEGHWLCLFTKSIKYVSEFFFFFFLKNALTW